MKLLRDILYKVGIVDLIGPTNVAIENISFDSRKITKYTLFAAVKGTVSDGHDYIKKAEDLGAIAIICEELPKEINPKVTYVKVENSMYSLGHVASNFYDNPSAELKLVGITGTNGKTTTATLLHDMFSQMGYKTGLISTVVNKITNIEIKATHTTPDTVQLNSILRQMVNNGCSHCFMEVSSHAIEQNRIAGLNFTGGAFTNITHDHLDYHVTFNNYIKAKKAFFDQLNKNAFALVNKDDKHSDTMLEHTKAKQQSFALKSFADFKCKIVESDFTGLLLNINNHEVWTKLIGNFNAYNVTAAYAISILLGEEEIKTLTSISSLNPVAGRFEYLKSNNNISAIVDYAHTPDALKNVLETINETRTGNEELITVVGCGGDRDKDKRPLMAKIASEKSSKVILTSDNPRSEDPELIISEMKSGVDGIHYKKVLAITNREEAIKTACSLAGEGDVILIAGKGHEKYQEIKGEKLPFDDVKVLKQALKNN